VRRDRQRVVTWLTAGLVLLQVGAAGIARLGRTKAAELLQHDESMVQQLQRDLERQRERQQEPPPVAAPTWELHPGPDVAATMQVLQELGDRAGIAVEDLRVLPSNLRGKNLYLLTGRGKPGPVCAFLAAAEAHLRLIVVENGRVIPAGDDQIGFEFGVATWHRGGDR
jgi:hypothetical protein